MWGRKKKNEAAKKLAPILQEESSKTRDTEWLRYTKTIEPQTEFISGFELTDEEADQLRGKMSEETSRQLSRDSVCRMKAMDVRTDKWSHVTVIEKPEKKLVMDWSQCSGSNEGSTIDFDVNNTYWKGDYYNNWDGVYYANNQNQQNHR